MQKIQLSEHIIISGIGAASGIVYTNNSLYIISDNSGYLYQYHLENNKLEKHSLLKNTSENISKKQKPDFEAITLKDKELHIFGSGSTQNRNHTIVYNIEKNTFTKHDLTELYQKTKILLNISDEDLNIEGVLFNDNKLYLFQRGNGVNSQNGIAIVSFNDPISFQTIQLPKIKHVETSFTDAILVDDKIYFLAAAEDTLSTYDDGEILGSIIGCIDLFTFEIDFTAIISNSHKFEGLTLYSKSEDKIEFLLCEDNDTEDLESIIYKLEIKI